MTATVTCAHGDLPFCWTCGTAHEPESDPITDPRWSSIVAGPRVQGVRHGCMRGAGTLSERVPAQGVCATPACTRGTDWTTGGVKARFCADCTASRVAGAFGPTRRTARLFPRVGDPQKSSRTRPADRSVK